MPKRRVVVTGMGVLACNGNRVPEFWDALRNGRHGIATITDLDLKEFATRFGGQVKRSTLDLAGGDKRIAHRKERFTLLALAAAAEAMAQSGLDYRNWADPFRVGVVVGAGIGGMAAMENEVAVLNERGPRRVTPMLVPKMIVDSAAGDISIAYGAKGPNYCVTTACATAAHCIGSSYNHIRHGDCDAMICGGTEAPITPLGISGFTACKALSTRNEDPGRASRPFDRDRDGFVIAEGAGILVLESLEHAQRRGAEILAELLGFGATGDAYHETEPDPDGRAGAACIQFALRDAGLDPTQIGYINAHGTSTRLNDKMETFIIKKVFGDHARKLAVSSTKSMTGHTLGGAGAVEAIATILCLRHRLLHPTINYATPDPDCDLDYVPNQAREQDVHYALSNNLGFWGHNASLVFGRFTG